MDAAGKREKDKMEIYWKSFKQMFDVLKKDKMLLAACIVPVLAGVLFRFGVPRLEQALCAGIHRSVCISPYYALIDIAYVMIAPILLCFSAVMLLLDERDEKIVNAFLVTPLMKRGYLVSRMGFPAAAAFVCTLVLLPLFRLTSISLQMTGVLALAGTLQGIWIAALILKFSKNRLEGMAVCKIATLTILGAAIPFVIQGREKYFFAWLPSFWMGNGMLSGSEKEVVVSIVVFLMWIFVVSYTKNVDGISLFGDSLPIGKRRGEER